MSNSKIKFFGSILILIICQLIISGQNRSSVSNCTNYKNLSIEVLKTANNLRNNGKFRTESVAVNLLKNTDKLLETCIGLDDERFQIKSTLAEFFVYRNELEKAEKVIKEFPNTLISQNKKNEGEFKLIKAIFYDAKGNKEKAKSLAKDSLKIASNHKNPRGAAEALWILGSISEEKGQGIEAIDYYKRSIRVGELKSIKEDYILESIIHIGNVSYQNKDYPTALKYYKLGREKSLEYEVERLVPFAHYHLGKYYFDVEKDSKKALESLESGLKYVQSAELKNYFITPIILQKIGVIHYTNKNKGDAIKYFTLAIEVAEKNNFQRVIPLAYKYLKELEQEKD